MASGSPTQEKATDRQCPNCHLYYDARGFDAHRAHCDGDEQAPSSTESATASGNELLNAQAGNGVYADESDESDPSIFDPLAEQDPEPPETTDETMPEPDCPTCETDEQVTTTDALQETLAERGRLTKQNLQKTRQNSHYCGNCNEVFADE